MNQSDLVKLVAEGAFQTNAATAKVVDLVLTTIMGALAKGEDVSLKGFGSFAARSREERVGRNPNPSSPRGPTNVFSVI